MDRRTVKTANMTSNVILLKNMNLITEEEADKTRDVFVGMWRPPLAEVIRSVKIVPGIFNGQNSRGFLENGKAMGFFWDETRIKECWLMGDFDSALYRRIVDSYDSRS